MLMGFLFVPSAALCLEDFSSRVVACFFMFLRRTLHKAIEHKTYTHLFPLGLLRGAVVVALHFPLSSSACERWRVEICSST